MRLELTRAAASLLYRPDLAARDQHQTCWCHRAVVAPDGGGAWLRAVDGSGARMTGVTTCGMVWACPTCASRIAEERRRELQFAMVQHVERGGAAYLVTGTFPHERGERLLPDTLEKLARATRTWKNSRTYKRIMGPGGSASRAGSVKSLEVTHGANDWHPHVHELVFAARGAFGEGAPDDDGRLTSAAIGELRDAWIAAIVKAGLCPVAKLEDAHRYALDVRGGEKAAEYIAKFGRDERWGQSREVTAHVRKVGTRDVQGNAHRTPFQILADAAAGDDDSARLFREYVDAFTGKRQLTWSPGLKTSLGVRDVSDEEIAGDEAPKPQEVEACRFTVEQLALITSRRALGEAQEFVALYCDNEYAQELWDGYCETLRQRPAEARPTLIHRRKHLDPETGQVRHGPVEAFGPGTKFYNA